MINNQIFLQFLTFSTWTLWGDKQKKCSTTDINTNEYSVHSRVTSAFYSMARQLWKEIQKNWFHSRHIRSFFFFLFYFCSHHSYSKQRQSNKFKTKIIVLSRSVTFISFYFKQFLSLSISNHIHLVVVLAFALFLPLSDRIYSWYDGNYIIICSIIACFNFQIREIEFMFGTNVAQSFRIDLYSRRCRRLWNLNIPLWKSS